MTDQKKTIQTSGRWPEDLHEQITKAAEESGRSFNSFVIQTMRKEMKRGEWLERESDDGK